MGAPTQVPYNTVATLPFTVRDAAGAELFRVDRAGVATVLDEAGVRHYAARDPEHADRATWRACVKLTTLLDEQALAALRATVQQIQSVMEET